MERLQACRWKRSKPWRWSRSPGRRPPSRSPSGPHPRAVGRGIADQIALACRVAPSEGSRRLHIARDLVLDMPHTLELLSRGELSGWTVRLITEQVSHLDRTTRSAVDADLAARHPELMGPREAAATTKRLAYQADPEAAMARARTARGDRRVTLRPAPDTMSLLTGLLPVEQGVACLAALQADVTARRADGDTRSKGQIMADTLVARLTGQDTAEDVGFEVGIQLPLGALINPDDSDRRRDPRLGRPARRPGPGADRQPPSPGPGGDDCSPTPPRQVGSRSSISITGGVGSPAGSPSSSAGATGPAATPSVMPRSVTSIISTATTTADPPPPATDAVSANAATTSASSPAGRSASSTPTPTPCSPPPPPATSTAATHPNRRDPGGRSRCPRVTECRCRRSPPPPWPICRIWDRSPTPSA